jgi:hypothetical protein
VLATKFQLRGVREKAGSLSLFAEFFTLDKHSTTAVTIVAASAPFDFLFERLARRTRTGVPLSVSSERGPGFAVLAFYFRVSVQAAQSRQ